MGKLVFPDLEVREFPTRGGGKIDKVNGRKLWF